MVLLVNRAWFNVTVRAFLPEITRRPLAWTSWKNTSRKSKWDCFQPLCLSLKEEDSDLSEINSMHVWFRLPWYAMHCFLFFFSRVWTLQSNLNASCQSSFFHKSFNYYTCSELEWNKDILRWLDELKSARIRASLKCKVESNVFLGWEWSQMENFARFFQ